MARYYIMVTIRVLLENILNAIGILNVKPLFLANKDENKRIAFQAYSIHLAQFYQTIIAELLQEGENVEISFIILAHPHFSIKSIFELKEFAHSSLHIPRENIQFYWEVMWEKFDLVMYTDVYAKFPFRRTKNCLLMHGPGLTTRIVSKHILRKTLFDFDVTMLNGLYDLDLVTTFYKGTQDSPKVISVGLPFLDRFETLSETKEMYFKKLHLDLNQKTILIAPSWRGLALIQKEKDEYFTQIISALKDQDVNIVMKLHACSFNKPMTDGYDWQKEIEKLSKNLKIRVDYDPDDIPALKYSDVLITDISSRAFNFMLLDKPVILYFPVEVSMDPWDRARIELMQRGSFVAKTPSDIKDILNQLRDRSLMSAERFHVSKQCFSNYGKATEAVIKLLKEELG